VTLQYAPEKNSAWNQKLLMRSVFCATETVSMTNAKRDGEELQEAIRAMHGCESRYVRSVPVREVFNDLVAWDGVVEVFDLIDHPKAKRCYAWSFDDGRQTRSVTVLELPPVDSPETAVKVAIAAKARELGTASGKPRDS
jgi:hypothetical protein